MTPDVTPGALPGGLSSTTCLVTGGMGFVGSNLVHTLAAGGARVRVVDALVPVHGGDRRNLDGLDGVEILEAEIGDEGVAQFLEGVDVVFNAAGQVSHHASMTDPLRDLDLNTRSQLAFLETLRRVRPSARIVLTSTRQVYGRPHRIPVDETHPVDPVDVNGIDKLACERFHLLYGKVHGLRPTVLRLTNTYGPRQNLQKQDLGVLPVFIRAALQGDTIRLFGDGEQRRDCLHVSDVVNACLSAAVVDAAAGRVFNIGNTCSWSLRRIAEAAVDAAGSGSEIEYVPWPEELARIDIGDFQCDISAAQATLGWSPVMSIDDGMADAVAFYRRHPWYLSST